MFEWLGRMLGLDDSKPIIKERSSKNGECLTSDEAAHIVYALKNNEPACPDCESGRLRKGPEGGCSVNCLCINCKSEFSICWLTEHQLIGERISEKQNCCPVRQMTIYGVGLIPDKVNS